ncbi:hypothetical protein Cantr_05933 [Candida viswanathii]|uniref:Uncharacterized protein n=1 Tax=Candida viswanathii TaxID=5486 RepID=A0A367XQ26_9ASCO|nr:hypothetical protein Cantr_05933 [Candida viswanathii]
MFNPSSTATFRPNIVTTTTTAAPQVPNSASSSVSNGSSNSLFSDITDSTTMSTNSNQPPHNLHLHQQQQQQNPPQQTTFGNFSTVPSPPRTSDQDSPDMQQQPTQSLLQVISGTGASSNPPINPRVSSKFTHHDIQILRQLLLAGEKHKWKQITKEINNSSHHSEHVAAAMSAPRTTNAVTSGIPAKNVLPTFIIKQYQQLLGLPNHGLYYGTLQSSIPYVVHGWNQIEDVEYQFETTE